MTILREVVKKLCQLIMEKLSLLYLPLYSFYKSCIVILIYIWTIIAIYKN